MNLADTTVHRAEGSSVRCTPPCTTCSLNPISNLRRRFGRVAANIAIMPGFGCSDGGSQNLEEAFGVGLAALHGARVAPSFASFGVTLTVMTLETRTPDGPSEKPLMQ